MKQIRKYKNRNRIKELKATFPIVRRAFHRSQQLVHRYRLYLTDKAALRNHNCAVKAVLDLFIGN